jgi:hypothetical protein
MDKFQRFGFLKRQDRRGSLEQVIYFLQPLLQWRLQEGLVYRDRNSIAELLTMPTVVRAPAVATAPSVETIVPIPPTEAMVPVKRLSASPSFTIVAIDFCAPVIEPPIGGGSVGRENRYAGNCQHAEEQ